MTQLFNNWISNPTSHLVNYLILLLVIGNVISATVICADDDSTDCDRSFSAYDLRTLFPESPRQAAGYRGLKIDVEPKPVEWQQPVQSHFVSIFNRLIFSTIGSEYDN
ncbi:hypothetical protein M3Y98_00390200 [Aphelenchoides besseyi]|nr:hypothetical protein M3Y98_00390200 [Aphelenchoides besseyi]